jgi:hypothetical protein
VPSFRSPRPNVVEGDNGVSIEVLGRTGIRYTEPGRSCVVDSEVLASPAIAVWPSGIRRWEPPHEGDPVTDDDRRRILQNIADAFASQGWGLQVLDRRDADDDRRRVAEGISEAAASHGWSLEVVDDREST